MSSRVRHLVEPIGDDVGAQPDVDVVLSLFGFGEQAGGDGPGLDYVVGGTAKKE
jgi:hypothetical protein